MCLYLCYLHPRYALLRYILLTFVEIMMAFMRRLLTILLLGLCLVACTQHSTYWGTLLDIESYIEERPDSALVVLEQIDISQLSNKEEKAKHAVLLSMALDKNYIDKTDFEVLQPAIDYYEDNGSATDKLRTFYYQGRIYQNAGNDALAMEAFVNALSEGGGSNDILTKARLYVAQGNIYYTLMKWDKVYEVNLNAADYFFQADKINSFINCTLKAVSAFSQKEDYQQSAKYLTECEKYLNIIPKASLAHYYSEYLTYLIRIEATDNIQETVGIYLSEIPDDLLDFGTLSNAYIALGEYGKALETISKIDNFPSAVSEIRYYAILSEIHHKLDNYEAALEAYIVYNQLNDAANMKIFEQETQFIEERHSLELRNIQAEEAKNRIIWLSIILVSILLVIVIYIRGRLKLRTIQQAHAEQEAERYKLLYEQIVYEKDNLSELLSHSNDLDNNVREVVAKRIELLNKFFTVYITNNSEISRKVDKELDALLANKGLFISSTRLAFVGSHPKFIKYLEEHNLSEQEIEICCLYAIGLKGKDIKAYTSQPRHYNQSADIRHKLGLTESDTNLSIFLRDLLKK